ncbi:ABC transporter ATP-binding protein [Paracrocinitomix mangrovi]|uniref:ABC transporter ATP-binding protein n=1 Tax=Paracrocinitomix mangrovi TaxID=2862509 RepID=UPI001C8D019D|nr:ABC transporter ATP-binding protein [Paracrocinitomix mangrovi]UKN01560.1 ABC transporter ATP-binding protein [Paracrocinitomix mangrovi]
MSEKVLEVSNISKQYRLGQFGTGTLSHDLNRFWHKVRGKEDPYIKVSEVNDRTNSTDGNYVWALNDVSFELNNGDVLGIIGKNGAGKSTLLKLLSKITSPTKGTIKMKGRMSSLLEVGTGFHLELTGRENIFLNGAILGMTKKEIASKLDEIVEFSGCAKYIDTPVKRYSTGMVVRLGFAVAAFLDSEILVVDEVLAVGDLEFQRKCIGKMQDISKSGRTVLFVSHNLTSVKALCTKGLLIENGVSTYFGGIEETISRYLASDDAKDEIEYDLTKFEGRLGTGQMKFEYLGLFVENNPGNKLFIGQSLKLKFRITSFELVRFIIAIHFYRSDETRLANVADVDSNFNISPFIGTKEFELTFDDIRLYPDNYKLSLWVGDAATHEHFDYLKHCATFEIIEGSSIVYRALTKSTGIFYFQPTWREIT